MSQIDYLIQELRLGGITNPAVLDAIKQVPREKFLPPSHRKWAYDNAAQPIDCQQTISQPHIVALMTQVLLKHTHPEKILEIGTGSGYQTAILAKLFKSIYTIERIETLYVKAKKTLSELGIKNIFYKLGDGSQGWPEEAPFDCIIVTAAAEILPFPLLEQMNPNGGLMVIPLGAAHHVQQLTLIKRNGDEIEETPLESVRFVPLIKDK